MRGFPEVVTLPALERFVSGHDFGRAVSAWAERCHAERSANLGRAQSKQPYRTRRLTVGQGSFDSRPKEGRSLRRTSGGSAGLQAGENGTQYDRGL